MAHIFKPAWGEKRSCSGEKYPLLVSQPQFGSVRIASISIAKHFLWLCYKIKKQLVGNNKWQPQRMAKR